MYQLKDIIEAYEHGLKVASSSVASDCSSLDGGQSEGNPSVQAVLALKQFREVVEKRIGSKRDKMLSSDAYLKDCLSIRVDELLTVVIDLDNAIAKAEGVLPTTGNR